MNKKFGHAIRNRRKDLKITQSELAEKIGCNYATICNIEKGESVTSRYIFEALTALGMDVDIMVKEN